MGTSLNRNEGEPQLTEFGGFLYSTSLPLLLFAFVPNFVLFFLKGALNCINVSPYEWQNDSLPRSVREAGQCNS